MIRLFLLGLVSTVVSCSSGRGSIKNVYYHKQLHDSKIEFTFGKWYEKDKKRDTVSIIYWDYLIYFQDAVTNKDTVVICEGFDSFRVLEDTKVYYGY
jgi:hypothetical protein